MGLVPVDFFKKLSANDIEIGFAEYQTTHVLASDLAADTAADTLPLIFSLSHNRAIETLREIEKTPNEGIGKHSNSDAIDAIVKRL